MSFFEKHLNKRLEDPEFKKAWEDSEQEYLNDKFSIYVVKELILGFGLTEHQAVKYLEDSVFAELLEEIPDFVYHYDSKYWAKQIYEDEKILERLKRIEDDPNSALKWKDVKRNEGDEA